LRSSRDNKVVVIAVLALVAVLISVAYLPVLQGGILTGYGGMTAEIVGANDGLDLYGWDTEAFVDVSTGSVAVVDVCQTQGWFDPTGVRMEITSRLTPISGATIDLGTIQKPWIDPDTGLEDGHETVQARILPMTMGVTVRTMGFGVHEARGIVFTIEIKENDFNFFESADETVAYIIDVYLINPPVTTNVVLMQVSPTVGGASVDGERVGTNPIPDWVDESLGTGKIDYHIPDNANAVQVWFTVDYAQPALSWPFNTRTEQEASWQVGVDVLVFGYWSVTNDPPAWTPFDFPAMWDAFLADLSAFLGVTGWLVFGIIIVLVLVIVFMIVRVLKGGRVGRTSPLSSTGWIHRKSK